MSRERPKSQIFTSPRSSISTFSGLRSLHTIQPIVHQAYEAPLGLARRTHWRLAPRLRSL
jgi:hypothetical protein